MNKKKTFIALALLLIIGGVYLMVEKDIAGAKDIPPVSSEANNKINNDNEAISFAGDGNVLLYHEAGNDSLKEDIIKTVNTVKAKNFSAEIKMGITSHHLPTAIAFIAEFYKTLFKNKSNRDLFVIVGPDHFEKCGSRISITDLPYETAFGEASIDNGIIKELSNNGVAIDNKCFQGEHSIGVEAVFIKYLFPNAKIVPIILSSGAKNDDLIKAAEVLKKHRNATVIESTDFSHYRTADIAARLDAESERMIKDLTVDNINLEHIDSPPSIKLIMMLANWHSLKPEIFGHANSYEFTGQSKNTTSYINAVFLK